MNKNLTELVFILDRSGSMAGLEKDTIGGFNSMLEKQKKEPGRALVTTVLFDHESTVIHDRAELENVRPLTGEEYFVRGSTALLDALGGAIRHIGDVQRGGREEDRPARTLFVITTDGMENASTVYSSREVKQMVEAQKERFGWEFLFLGANMDAVSAAADCGIGADHAVRYSCDSRGTGLNYEVLNDAVCSVRGGRKLSRAWKERIEEDYRERGDR